MTNLQLADVTRVTALPAVVDAVQPADAILVVPGLRLLPQAKAGNIDGIVGLRGCNMHFCDTPCHSSER